MGVKHKYLLCLINVSWQHCLYQHVFKLYALAGKEFLAATNRDSCRSDDQGKLFKQDNHGLVHLYSCMMENHVLTLIVEFILNLKY